jgi:hypothetical protein
MSLTPPDAKLGAAMSIAVITASLALFRKAML